MGVRTTSLYAVQDDGPGENIDLSIDEALETAFRQRPDLLSLKEQKESARESIKAAQRAHYPTFSGVASGVWVNTGFPLDHGYTAGLNVSVPLFTGFITQYQVAEAQANLTVAEGSERSLKQTVALDVEQGYIDLREAAEQMQSTETTVRQGRENLELANERYASGLAIGVEVADAIVAYANARLGYIAAYFDRKIARARIEKAIGGQWRRAAAPPPKLTSLEK
jgi:outer membrane protein TolC